METGRLQFSLAWKDYKRRRRWFFGAWLGGFVVVASLAALLNRMSLGDLAFWVLGPLWLVAFVIAGLRLEFFRCPRCHRHFFCARWYYNLFARRCVHCGLPKWSDTDNEGILR
ncbi:MAG: hypothetical protein ABSB32_12705 [Thermodesulfobacteriota bacterium]|jgi:hypothetical protein